MNTKHLFWILFLLNLFNYIDRQVLYSVFPLLQTDLHLSDWQLGTLASVFMLVYMCYAPVVGYFADRSRGEYGPDEGLRRCLEVLGRREVQGTFFVPGRLGWKRQGPVPCRMTAVSVR